MEVTKNTEIRHLPAKYREPLAQMLEYTWVLLMEGIPKHLSENNEVAFENNLMKYTSDQIKLVEKHCEVQKIDFPALILFDEWGSSGKIRPTVGHLLKILIKLELFRAADYVSIFINESCPKRPTEGPAAPIQFPSFEDEIAANNSQQYGDNKNDPDAQDNNKGYSQQNKVELPEAGSPSLNLIDLQDSSNIDNESDRSHTPSKSASSTENSNTNQYLEVVSPVDQNSNKSPGAEVPESQIRRASYESQPMIPPLDDLLKGSISLSSDNNAKTSSTNIPMLSAFQQSESVLPPMPNLSELQQSESIPRASIPNLSAFDITEEDKSMTTSDDDNHNYCVNGDIPHQINNFSAPTIPNLSVFEITQEDKRIASHDDSHNRNTNGYVQQRNEIENFQYSHIEAATDNFNDRKFNPTTMVGRKLGEGGFSNVYLAINLRSDTKYSAIKKLHSNSHAKSSEYFFREINLLTNVRHANVIKLLGFSSHQDELCLVYEYINGGNLYEKLENCRLDRVRLHWKERIHIARGCSDGIRYLHSSAVNIIHRDIKSSNILLDGHTPKICDFGFVKNANFNTTTMAVGTNPYMAPETVRGTVSIAVDIFAFGVVILELVSGFKVLDNSNRNEIIDLVTYFETSLKQSDYHITFTDKKAGDWKNLNQTKSAAEELVELARKCLLPKSDRLDSIDVNIVLAKIQNDYCT